jgi:hypothetical protein
MINFLKKKNKSTHDKNVRIEKYFSQDGTPMIKTECICGYIDNGPVYADIDNWKEKIIVKRNNIVIINEFK